MDSRWIRIRSRSQAQETIILEHFGLDSDCKKLTYNGDKDTKEENWELEPLPREEATSFRALAARMNYLSQDCPDLQFPIKQCSRDMASPFRGSWKKIKRLPDNY